MACRQCGIDVPNIFLGTPDNRTLLPPDESNNVYVPDQSSGPDWVGAAGDGIEITDGGTQGHEPTIGVALFESTDNAIQFVNGELFVASADASPDWTSPNTSVAGGIRVISGGTQGHSPTFNIEISDASPVAGSFDANGALVLTSEDTLPWQSSAGENVVVVPGDNPGGVAGNGHRPVISVRAGAGLCSPLEFRCTENATGQFTVEIVNPQTGGAVTLGGPF